MSAGIWKPSRDEIIDEIVAEIVGHLPQLAAQDGVDVNHITRRLWNALSSRLLASGTRVGLLTDDFRRVQREAGMPAPKHSVTYLNYIGEPAVRIQGPQAHYAEGHEVEVTRPDGSTDHEKLTQCAWRGLDLRDLDGRPASGQPVAIYRYAPKSRQVFSQ